MTDKEKLENIKVYLLERLADVNEMIKHGDESHFVLVQRYELERIYDKFFRKDNN